MPLFNLFQEPLLGVNQSFNGFFHQRFSSAALLSSHARELVLNIGVELYFHVVSL